MKQPLTKRVSNWDRLRSRRAALDGHWLRSIVFTVGLVGLVAVATGADWLVTVVSISVSTIGFGFFYLLFPGGAHFGMALANFLAIYACMFEFFRAANFPHAPRPFMLASLALPVFGFLAICFWRRRSLYRLIRARQLRELERLPTLSRWLFATMAVGAASFALPEQNLSPQAQGVALFAAMSLISLFVVIAVHDVVLVVVDVAIVFESVAARLDRLLMPMLAFLTFYGLLIVVFACLYRIADLTTPAPQFALHGEPYRVRFVDALYYSTVTIATVGFGDLSPTTFLTRALTGMEIVCGILMLLFGFSEIMRNAGPDSQILEPPERRHNSPRDPA